MLVRIEESWRQILQPEFDKPYFELLTDYVRHEYQTTQVFPPAKLIFNAFNSCPFNQVKVVIIGQDPYHDLQQAHGLAFSVNDNIPIPPSLNNIFQEIHQDLGTPIPTSGNLTRWAQQGVLLLNATLTVRAHQPASHQNKGWEVFTDAVIQNLAAKKKHIVYMLWGSYAQRKAAFVPSKDNLILKAPHPSPLSAYRGFFGCHHFSQANQYLLAHSLSPINW
ncbi:MAG: uracil-DNA glycosylase [Paludibacteraceae bacterium]|nr:uracil-DNA glycosylase [Paludibacteraceae bacterium]